jgi:DNA invertase Pin-like site-specific DNA recombinase
MIAAIYARKSTEQNGMSDEERSVARQIEHAKSYAARKGWAVAEEHVYADDGISGAEFERRPSLMRLLAAIRPRPPFQALVVSEESRLGREVFETGYVLKQLLSAGVRVFSYLDDKEFALNSATDKVLLAVTSALADMEREKARQRTRDALLSRAEKGYVTGGAVFGYDNVPVVGEGGKRQCVERRINPKEAAVARRIFELLASGKGYKQVTKTLNAEAVPAPRPRPLLDALERPRDRPQPALRRSDRLGPHEEAGRLGAEAAEPAPGERVAPARPARGPPHRIGRLVGRRAEAHRPDAGSVPGVGPARGAATGRDGVEVSPDGVRRGRHVRREHGGR